MKMSEEKVAATKADTEGTRVLNLAAHIRRRDMKTKAHATKRTPSNEVQRCIQMLVEVLESGDRTAIDIVRGTIAEERRRLNSSNGKACR